jgi:quercetin dioxygenase-like cupin family protein
MTYRAPRIGPDRRSGCDASRALPIRSSRPGIAGWVAGLVLILVGAVACGGGTSAVASASGSTPASAGQASLPPVVRDVLAAGRPSAAPDDNLELVRYTIQPDTALAPHHHPGMQLALIESGTLTYTVIEGTVVVHAAGGATRSIGPGETGTIGPGEWIVEDETIVHFGKNAGSEPVVILAASLLAADEPPAILVSPAPS